MTYIVSSFLNSIYRNWFTIFHSRWQKQSEEQEERDTRNYEIDENDQRGREIDDDYQNNKEFESHEMMQQKEINRDVSRGGSNSGDKSMFSRNSSQGETSSQTGLELEKITDSARVSEETTTGLWLSLIGLELTVLERSRELSSRDWYTC